MEALLAPVLITLAISLCIGIISAVLAKIFKPADEPDSPAEKPAGKIAVIRTAKPHKQNDLFIYEGPQSCMARALFFSDNGSAFFCPGYGDCAKACPAGAMTVVNGTPAVDPALCTGCGKCAKECPAGFITIESEA